PYKSKKNSLNTNDKELIAQINSALQLAKKQLSFEGEKVFVTIPDNLCNTSFIYSDEEMSETDGWEFSKWTLDQRYSPEDNSTNEYFGRLFKGEVDSVYSLRVSSLLSETIKMSIQEMGGDPVWMGTESSAFYGLNPNRGVTLFLNDKSGYEYFHYSKNCFLNGTAKFSKDKWKLLSTDGSYNEKDIFKGQIIIPGKLSYRRKSHFKGKRIRQVEAFKNIKKNDVKIPKEVKNNDLYISTAIINGNVYGSALNFFDSPGLQEYDDKKTIPEISKEKNRQKKRKPLKKKKTNNFQQIFAYLFFFAALAAVIFREKLPEIYDTIEVEVRNFIDPKVPQTTQETPLNKSAERLYSEFQKKSFIKSQSTVNAITKIFNSIEMKNIINIEAMKGEINLEFLDLKSTNVPVDTIGNILNYSLRQMGALEQYKHGYLIQYPVFRNELINLDDYISLNQLENDLASLNNLDIKKFDVLYLNAVEYIPLVLSSTNLSTALQILSYLETTGSNLVLEKFIYNYNNQNNSFTIRFFITFANYNDS
ncbi:MAG: hypothetical protein VYB52_02720, partial [Candidatus Neomarinimicrobiota bacterium]|nr:hypothetical protein [Candidatus Neomarinimicrobiota bacterium]